MMPIVGRAHKTVLLPSLAKPPKISPVSNHNQNRPNKGPGFNSRPIRQKALSAELSDDDIFDVAADVQPLSGENFPEREELA